LSAVNEVGPILDAIIFALAVLLGFIVCAAALRYRDVRFGFVAGALATLGLVGVVSATAVLWPNSIPGAELGTIPAVLIIVSEALFYLSFVIARSWAPHPPGS
jgi:hypothetical protein